MKDLCLPRPCLDRGRDLGVMHAGVKQSHGPALNAAFKIFLLVTFTWTECIMTLKAIDSPPHVYCSYSEPAEQLVKFLLAVSLIL